MSPSRFEFDWPTLQLLIITVLAFAIGMAGCGPLADTTTLPPAASVPAELAPLQGKWKYDEARSNKANGMEAGDASMSDEERAFFDAMKTLGVSMSDIEISGTQITQLGGLLRAQYDLLDYRTENGRIVGTALWHEDRNDPGDASDINVTLELNGDSLIFTRDEDGHAAQYFFHR